MQINDKVKPARFVNCLRPGTILDIEGDKVVVRWILGSGWGHTVDHNIEELEVVK